MNALTDADRKTLGAMLNHGPEGQPIYGMVCGDGAAIYLAGKAAGRAELLPLLRHWYDEYGGSYLGSRAKGKPVDAELDAATKAILDATDAKGG